MIAYIIGGSGFGGCVDYVTRRKLEEKLYKALSKRQKTDERKYESNRGEDIIDHLSKDWQLLAATTDVRIYEGRKAMADDIARPTRRRKPIKDPVGHISLDFHPADAPRMTDELMAAVAQDYMEQMGLTDTPYIVVRHYDKAHPHCQALNLKHRLMQGKSKLNTDVSKLRGKEKVRYQLVHDLAGFYLTPSVTDWNSYIDLLRRNGITVREKIGKCGRVNLYYGVDKQEFWYKKLDPFLSRENLELKFKARRENQQAEKSQLRTSPQPQPQSRPKPQPQPKQPEPIVIPPLPDVVCGVKIDRPRQQAYQDGQIISIGICEPGGVVPLTHWIWYDFDKREPVISRAYPSDNKIPEAFQRQLAAKQSPASSSQGAGIRLSSPSLSGNIPEEQGFSHSDGIPDDFKHFLEMHPGMSFDEAKRRFKDEQKAKQRRKGPKLH